MKGTIKAMSSEAKASAWIIGSLPFLVGGMVYLTSPQYLELLRTTPSGQLVIAGCAIWMGIGIFVMRNIINFDI
jgi:tight adherence protein B